MNTNFIERTKGTTGNLMALLFDGNDFIRFAGKEINQNSVA